jgi:hypothetical protein
MYGGLLNELRAGHSRIRAYRWASLGSNNNNNKNPDTTCHISDQTGAWNSLAGFATPWGVLHKVLVVRG